MLRFTLIPITIIHIADKPYKWFTSFSNMKICPFFNTSKFKSTKCIDNYQYEQTSSSRVSGAQYYYSFENKTDFSNSPHKNHFFAALMHLITQSDKLHSPFQKNNKACLVHHSSCKVSHSSNMTPAPNLRETGLNSRYFKFPVIVYSKIILQSSTKYTCISV